MHTWNSKVCLALACSEKSSCASTNAPFNSSLGIVIRLIGATRVLDIARKVWIIPLVS